MTPFTLVMAYYENPSMLREHVRTWLALPDDLVGNLSVILVDDGSPQFPAMDALEAHPVALQMLLARIHGFQVWRMGVDVRWNQDACRNIGVREAKTTWVMMTDMDHVVPEKTWQTLMTARLKKSRAYRFSRVNAPAHDPYKPHPNSWAMARGLFWRIGGYDEALAGNYGTDGDFMVRTRREAGDVVELADPIVRFSRDVIADASTRTLERKSDQDRLNVNRIVKARADNPEWKPLHFSFPCTRVM